MSLKIRGCFFAILGALFIAALAVRNSYGDATGKTAAILFPDLSMDLNLLDSQQPASIVLLQLLSQPLVRSSVETPKGFDHILTDAVIRSFDNKKLSLRIRRGVSFSSGEPLRLVDISYSIERCSSSLPLLQGLKVEGKNTVFSEAYSEVWVEFEIPSQATYPDFINSLGRCPIVEYKNNVIFGDLLGVGANLIAAGEFNLQNFRPGKSYQLVRSGTYPDRKGANDLEIGVYKDPKHGLRQLQSGSADAIINDETSVNELAATDSTLEVLPCFNRWLIRRKGFKFNCTNDFGLNGIGYVS